MARHLRLFIVAAGSIALVGCAQFGTTGIDRAEPLGIQGTGADILPPLPPLPPPPVSLGPGAFDKTVRDQYVELWMARSDGLCREYKDRLIRASRDVRFATDASRTVLSGLATIFTTLSVIHPLTGAATIIGGVGAAADDDVFHKQGGELIASAIQTARESQANQIEINLTSPPAAYSIWRAHRDVVNYHNMCSLETALSQVRSSLKATSPDGGTTPPAAQGMQLPSALPTALRSPGSPLPDQSTRAPPALAPAPAPAPAPQPNPRRVPPDDAELQALRTALGFNRVTKKFDRARIAILKQCYPTIGLPEGTLLQDLMNVPQLKNKIKPATDCISAKIATGSTPQ